MRAACSLALPQVRGDLVGQSVDGVRQGGACFSLLWVAATHSIADQCFVCLPSPRCPGAAYPEGTQQRAALQQLQSAFEQLWQRALAPYAHL